MYRCASSAPGRKRPAAMRSSGWRTTAKRVLRPSAPLEGLLARAPAARARAYAPDEEAAPEAAAHGLTGDVARLLHAVEHVGAAAGAAAAHDAALAAAPKQEADLLADRVLEGAGDGAVTRVCGLLQAVRRPARAVGRALMKIPQPRFDFGDQKRYDKLAIFRPSSNVLKSLKSLTSLKSRPFGSHGGVVCVPHVRS